MSFNQYNVREFSPGFCQLFRLDSLYQESIGSPHPPDNQLDEDTYDFSMARCVASKLGIFVVRQNSGFRTKSVCMFVTKCYCYMADDDDAKNENEPSEKNPMMQYSNI